MIKSKNNKAFFLIFVLFWCQCDALIAQKVEVKYRYYIPENISYQKAISNALAYSKSEALRKAGIVENITNYTSMMTAEIKDDFSGFFRDELLISINGAVKEWKHITAPKKGYNSEKDQFFIDIAIEANVLKYRTKNDPTFAAKIDGLIPSYISSDDTRIDLKIKPYQNCYLKVFYISESEAQILYPIEVDQHTEQPTIFANKKLIKNDVLEIDYLYPETEKGIEFGKLIIVITKNNIPYTESKANEQGFFTKTTIEDIFEWILIIEPNLRTEYYRQFIISKN